PNRLYVGVLLERVRAEIPPEAALLVAAERRARVESVVGVDPDGAGLDLAGHTVRQLDVPGPDRRDQPINRSVGDRDRLVRTLETDHREHGSEDLLLRDLHLRFHLGEYGGFDEEPLAVGALQVPLAAAVESRAFLHARPDIGQNALHLWAGD